MDGDDVAKGMDELRSLRQWFLGELSKLRKPGTSGIDEIAAIPLIEVWHKLLDWATTADLATEEVEWVVNAAKNAEVQYNSYKRNVGDAKSLALVGLRGHLDVFPSLFDELIKRGAFAPEIDALRNDISLAGEEALRSLSIVAYVTQRMENLDEAVLSASNSAHQAGEALALAEKAATKTATGALENSFKSTASNSATTAWVFRLGTIVTLAVTVVFGLVYAAGSTAESVDNWHEVVYRVAILSALAAIAAYLGRQASNYHRIATWAHAIEIQLKAFRGFINEIEDEEARQAMFVLFAKRVLEAPPDGKGSNDEVTNLIQPLVDQASKFRPTT
ncbi:hypothetical protein M0722_12900 [Microbacterium sp. KSW4-16]|uniref:hypothetical protein n=1 Tax=Microbacterium aurugineum TaxID=2851642 RepID=UPI0020BD4A69|nr:hypothetical protein [Microbacterium aurugineum]MCK8468094.1 hypothetical protein [Microbacterium aurugineum]